VTRSLAGQKYGLNEREQWKVPNIQPIGP
jgi:hypothetical protein